MQYGLIYRMEFKNIEGYTIRTDIIPTDVLIPDDDEPTIISLKGGASPLIISASNNDEDKFTPIRSKSAKIEIRTDTLNGIDSSTFSQGGDSLWRVNCYLQDTPQLIFQGFLMMADNQQPFQPDPQYVTLTATDHLAALKEAKLTDLDGLNPIGKYRVADLINFCLRKTGLELSFFVINNLRAGSGQLTFDNVDFSANSINVHEQTKFFYPGQQITITGSVSNNITTTVTSVLTLTNTVANVAATLVDEIATNVTITDTASASHWYDIVYLDAKTFESTIGESINCYDVLSKILGEDCYITQWHGNWWIMRVDEMEDNPFYVAEFSPEGVYISTAVDTIEKSIGRLEDSKFANADTLLRFVRPHQFSRETFNYTPPLEIPCNINFSRGDFVSGTNPKLYELDCWTKRRGGPGAYNTPITITDFIVREFNDNDYEVERYIKITPQTGHSGFSSTDDEYIESEAIPVNIGDKFVADIDWRFDADISSSSADLRLFRLILIGNDGSMYILGEAVVGDGHPIWYPLSFTSPLNTGKGATPVVFGSQDETEWQNKTWTAPPVPVTGELFIWLNQAYTNAAVPSGTVINYANLRFEYIPLINGTYAKVTAQQLQVTRLNDGYLANRDNEVFISDSPAPILKGSMFLNPAGEYILFPNWFAAAPWGNSYPPNQDYLHPYGYIQVFSVWNQYKGYNNPSNGRGIGINIFQGSVYGLTDSWPDLLHKILLTDANQQTNNRFFMILSIEQDWKSCIWQGTFIEVYNRVILKSYNDTFTFKYINE